MLTITSGYNLTSGYATILHVILEQFAVNKIRYRPRFIGDVSVNFLKYFENIEYFKEKCDLFLFPSCADFDICNPLFHINSHFNTLSVFRDQQ